MGTVAFVLANTIVIVVIATSGAAKPTSCGGFSGYSGGGSCTSDLVVTNIDAPDPGKVAGRLFYLVEVENKGPDTAFEVQVTDQLPATVTIDWIMLPESPYGSCTAQGRAVFCTFYEVTVHEKAAVTIVTRPILPGVIKNIAIASSTSFDPNTRNNSRTQQTTINP
jgi:uncharacterized repeat protein (TIGR01451 family)